MTYSKAFGTSVKQVITYIGANITAAACLLFMSIRRKRSWVTLLINQKETPAVLKSFHWQKSQAISFNGDTGDSFHRHREIPTNICFLYRVEMEYCSLEAGSCCAAVSLFESDNGSAVGVSSRRRNSRSLMYTAFQHPRKAVPRVWYPAAMKLAIVLHDCFLLSRSSTHDSAHVWAANLQLLMRAINFLLRIQ